MAREPDYYELHRGLYIDALKNAKNEIEQMKINKKLLIEEK